ncbi:MAG: hypothetical protein COB10_03800 [Planctomycetota bacterium]|nr:MAG: hypothetical protein COB10_03800 [Planctomycetota bacterium]
MDNPLLNLVTQDSGDDLVPRPEFIFRPCGPGCLAHGADIDLVLRFFLFSSPDKFLKTRPGTFP